MSDKTSNDDVARPGPEARRAWWAQDRAELRERVRVQTHADQITALVDSLGGRDVVGIYPSDDDPGRAEYLFRRGLVLARDADVERVHRALTESFVQAGGQVEDRSLLRWDGRQLWDKRGPGLPEPVAGVTAIPLPQATPEFAQVDWYERLDQRLGVGVATPDHVVHITGNAGGCPATEPETAVGRVDPAVDSSVATSGRGVRVTVVDTGLIPEVALNTGWLGGVTGDPEPPDLRRYRAHGTFIAGVVRAMAPQAEVHVLNTYRAGGGIFESDLAPALERAMTDNPDVISMSAGTRTRHGRALVTMQNFWHQRLEHSGTVLVAAAGNDGDRGPFYPAGFRWAVGVGALAVDETLASYSNFGGWVKVFARGSDIVNAYPNGPITYYEPQNQDLPPAAVDNWLASWSGTSFSTPLVSGLIAARMTWSGETAREAADALLSRARGQALRGIGPVLRPGDAAP